MTTPRTRRRPGWILAGIIIGFVVLRLPGILLSPGGQDEQCYAPPGYTVATEGIPRLPYVRNEDPDNPFYKADEALFALPPGFFYLQAPGFLLFPPGYATSRLPSLIAAIAAIWLTYELGRRSADPGAALWAAGLYAGSRVLLFPATFARPDMLCGAVGLAAILVLWDWQDRPTRRRLLLAGGLLGVGLLCHPFAIVYCLLAGAWVILAGGRWTERINRSLQLVAITTAVCAAWTPLILAHVDAFRHQFVNNVLAPQGPGLFGRLVFPWPFFEHQWKLLHEQAGTWQTALMLTGGLAAIVWDLRGSDRSARRAAWLTCGAIYLLTACQGLHPTKGYQCFVGALIFLAVGRFVSRCGQWLSRAGRSGCGAAWLGSACLLLLMLPGSGARGWLIQVRHWSEVDYDGPRFSQSLLATLPADGHFVVDTPYVFDFWLAGRDTILVADPFNEYPTENYAYDFLIVGRNGLDKKYPQEYRGIFVRAVGQRDNLLSCYAEIYRSPASASSSSAASTAGVGNRAVTDP
jgi:hypothetical protein